MTLLTEQELKTLRKNLIKTIKERVKPFLKDSEYRTDKEENWAYPSKHPDQTGKPIKWCVFKRQVKPKLLYQTGETVIGFTSNEVITNYGLYLETISFSNISIEDLQVLAQLDLKSLVKVERASSSMSSRKKAVEYEDVSDNNH
jgi:hypothetical protein